MPKNPTSIDLDNTNNYIMTNCERKTLKLHILFSIFNGSSMGVTWALYEVVARRALGASAFQITLLVMGLPVAWLLSSIFTSAMQSQKSYRPFLIGAGFLRIAAMAGMFWVQSPWQYLVLMIMFLLPLGIINPAQNFILAKNYPNERRGAWFGIATSVMNAMSLITAISGGALLDINEQWFRWIYFIVGILGGIASFVLAAIPVPQRKALEQWENPIKKIVSIFKTDKKFWIFERNFFIYGFGFLLLAPVIPLFMVDALRMSYKEISFARGVLGMLGMIVFSPFTGRILDKHNPFTYASKIFALLALFPLMLLGGNIFGKFAVYAAYICYSLAMAGITIVWNLGSIFFAEPDYEATYQSVHITMTGLRGLIAPVFGFVAMHFLGYPAAFGLSFSLFLLASFMMKSAAKKSMG